MPRKIVCHACGGFGCEEEPPIIPPMEPDELRAIRAELGAAWGFVGPCPLWWFGALLGSPRGNGSRLSVRTLHRYLHDLRQIPDNVAARARYWHHRAQLAARFAAWERCGRPSGVWGRARGRPLPELPHEVNRRRLVMLERKRRAGIYTAARAAAWERGEAFVCPFTGRTHAPPAGTA